MLFYMNTRTFLNLFLENEDDWEILDTYYLMVSHRIHVGTNCSNQMILRGGEGLMPDGEILWIMDQKEQREQYFHHLSKYKPLFAGLIYKSITDNYNTVMLSSVNEMKPKYATNSSIPYMDWIRKYIEKEFMYPVYDYKKFVKGKCPIYDYDEDSVKQYCKHIIKEDMKLRKEIEKQPEMKRSKLVDLSKKQLRAELKKYDIPVDKSFSRSELISMMRGLL